MIKDRVAITCRFISDRLCNVAEFLSSVGLIVIAVVLLLQVVLRFVFRSGLIFAEELSKYTVIWVVMLTGGILAKHNDFIKADFLDSLYSRGFIKYRDLVCKIILSCMLLTLIKEGWNQAINAWTSNARLTTLPLTFFWAYISIPVCGSIMLMQLILSAFVSRQSQPSTKNSLQQERN